jgi:hypothetical protein
MRDSCNGILGLIFGHNYKPRYSQNVKIPDNKATMLNKTIEQYMGGLNNVWWANEGVIKQISKGFESINANCNTYNGDVCVRCGDVINRK